MIAMNKGKFINFFNFLSMIFSCGLSCFALAQETPQITEFSGTLSPEILHTESGPSSVPLTNPVNNAPTPSPQNTQTQTHTQTATTPHQIATDASTDTDNSPSTEVQSTQNTNTVILNSALTTTTANRPSLVNQATEIYYEYMLGKIADLTLEENLWDLSAIRAQLDVNIHHVHIGTELHSPYQVAFLSTIGSPISDYQVLWELPLLGFDTRSIRLNHNQLKAASMYFLLIATNVSDTRTGIFLAPLVNYGLQVAKLVYRHRLLNCVISVLQMPTEGLTRQQRNLISHLTEAQKNEAKSLAYIKLKRFGLSKIEEFFQNTGRNRLFSDMNFPVLFDDIFVPLSSTPLPTPLNILIPYLEERSQIFSADQTLSNSSGIQAKVTYKLIF